MSNKHAQVMGKCTSNGEVHKYKSRTRPSKVEYVDAWQTFVVDVDSSNRPRDHQEWVNDIDMQLQICKSKLHANAISDSDQTHGQQALVKNANSQETINETSLLKQKHNTCEIPSLPGIMSNVDLFCF